jgi:hypothetical protein
MSRQNRGLGSAVRFGFGLAIGYTLFRIIFSALTFLTVGLNHV